MLLDPRLVVIPVLNKDKHNNHKYGHTTASPESGTAQKLNWIHIASVRVYLLLSPLPRPADKHRIVRGVETVNWTWL